MKQHRMVNFFLLASIIFLLGIGSSAFAIPCGSGSVSGSVSCQDGTGNNDFINPTTAVNDQNFFGYMDWDFLQKQNTPGALETGVDIGLIVSPTTGTQVGAWSFNASAWDTYTDIMIVLKSGNTGGVFFSGYLLDNTTEPFSGKWDTGGKDLSHLSVYGRAGRSNVPESATLFLMGTGLIGLAGFRRKRTIKTS